MIRFGRALSWFSICTIVPLMVVLSIPALYDAVRARPTLSLPLDLLAASSAFATLVPWPMAIWHWRRRHPPHPNWVLWGLAVFFGAFLGAWGYWLVATKHYDRVDSEADQVEVATSAGGAP